MPWNFMQVELMPQDALARPMVGPGGFTRDQAHAEIQGLLDRYPALASVAASWRRGAKGDTVYAGLFIWCIYEHPDGEDPRIAAIAWVEGLTATMRSAGVDVATVRAPDSWKRP